ncbi:MAG: hypothetical protein IMZ71_00830 [Chloroflexi bacterium]|nr:hypothetical protein [Chloroflexota bacterium]
MEIPKRKTTPNFIIFLCLFGLVAFAVALYTAVTTWTPPFDWPNIAVAGFSVIGLVGLIGLWQMRRWGLWLFTALSVLIVGVSLLDGIFTWYSTILQAMLIMGGFAFYEQMR